MTAKLAICMPALIIFSYYMVTAACNYPSWDCRYAIEQFNIVIPITQIFVILVFMLYESTKRYRANQQARHSSYVQYFVIFLLT